MKVKKELIVLSFSELKPSKFGEDYHRVTLKSVDESDKKSYSLNLRKQIKGKHDSETYNNWYKWCVPGNVLEVVMQSKNPLNVDQFMRFKVMNGKERSITYSIEDRSEEIKKESIKEDMLQLQLDQISRKVNRLNNNVDKLLEILEK